MRGPLGYAWRYTARFSTIVGARHLNMQIAPHIRPGDYACGVEVGGTAQERPDNAQAHVAIATANSTAAIAPPKITC